MSKRVSNKKGRARKTLARAKVTYGWRKQKLFAMFGKDRVLSGAYLEDVQRG